MLSQKRGRKHSDMHKGDDIKIEADIGVMQPQAKEYEGMPVTGRS